TGVLETICQGAPVLSVSELITSGETPVPRTRIVAVSWNRLFGLPAALLSGFWILLNARRSKNGAPSRFSSPISGPAGAACTLLVTGPAAALTSRGMTTSWLEASGGVG